MIQFWNVIGQICLDHQLYGKLTSLETDQSFQDLFAHSPYRLRLSRIDACSLRSLVGKAPIRDLKTIAHQAAEREVLPLDLPTDIDFNAVLGAALIDDVFRGWGRREARKSDEAFARFLEDRTRVSLVFSVPSKRRRNQLRGLLMDNRVLEAMATINQAVWVPTQVPSGLDGPDLHAAELCPEGIVIPSGGNFSCPEPTASLTFFRYLFEACRRQGRLDDLEQAMLSLAQTFTNPGDPER